MRPKSITFLCVILLLIGGLQLLGSMGGILIGNGIGPERVFKSTEKYEVEEKYLIKDEAEVPVVVPDEGQTADAIPEHLGAASQYGFWISLLVLLSVAWLWQMRAKGAYLFAVVCGGNIVTQVIWQPEWIIQSQTGVWFSLLLPIVYFAVVLPHWKTLNVPLEDRPAKPEADVIGLDVFKIGSGENAIKQQETEKS
ncbi:hypothetical protein ACFL3U_01820 [Pseudomonadota bacterium]